MFFGRTPLSMATVKPFQASSKTVNTDEGNRNRRGGTGWTLSKSKCVTTLSLIPYLSKLPEIARKEEFFFTWWEMEGIRGWKGNGKD